MLHCWKNDASCGEVAGLVCSLRMVRYVAISQFWALRVKFLVGWRQAYTVADELRSYTVV
jgi:hypothetical protein